jgi:hypothetical protein
MSVSKVTMGDYKLRSHGDVGRGAADWVRVPLVGIHTLIRADW